MRINQSDQVLMLLRARLENLRKQSRASRVGKAEKVTNSSPPLSAQIQGLSERSDLTDAGLLRLVVHDVLSAEWGNEFVQSELGYKIMDKIVNAMQGDESVSKLICDIRDFK